MTVSMRSLARKVTLLVAENAIEDRRTARALGRAAHLQGRAQLTLRNAARDQANTIESDLGSVSLAQKTIGAVKKVGAAAEKVDAAIEAGPQPDAKTEKPWDPNAATEPLWDSGAEMDARGVRDTFDAAFDEGVSFVADVLSKGLGSLRQEVQGVAQRHEKAAAELAEVGATIRDDAVDHLLEVFAIEAEGAAKDR